ncbi:hypothetical protein ACFX12_000013 [Malus domestica]
MLNLVFFFEQFRREQSFAGGMGSYVNLVPVAPDTGLPQTIFIGEADLRFLETPPLHGRDPFKGMGSFPNPNGSNG